MFIHKSLTFKEMAKTLNRKEVVAESPRHVLRDALGEATPSEGRCREGEALLRPVCCLPATFITFPQLIRPLEIQQIVQMTWD